MDWTGEATTERGVTERTFGLEHDGRKIPGILWAPEAGPEGCPLLLLGHGGTNHKRTDYVLASARCAFWCNGTTKSYLARPPSNSSASWERPGRKCASIRENTSRFPRPR